MAKKKKVKDQLNLNDERFGMFMDEDMFNLEIDIGREYIHNDVNFTIKLYRINAIDSTVNKLYREAKPGQKKFFPPVKIRGIVDISEGEQISMGGISRNDSGPLTFSFYIQDIEDLDVDITKGDIIAYNPSGRKERYYEVVDPNYITDDSTKTIAGMKPYWRKVTANPVKGDVVPFT